MREMNVDNFTEEEVGPLFSLNPQWNVGDLPLLNRKIFKGTRVTIREHPYIASVRRNIVHYCMASMLTKNLFVTVAHPLVGVPIEEVGVSVGENYADRGAALLTAILIVIHEDFDKYNLKADLALIRVYENSDYRAAVKSIRLIEPSAHLDKQTAFVTGWGRCDRTGTELCFPRSSQYTPGECLDPMLRTVSFVIQEPNHYCQGYSQNGVQLSKGMACLGVAREADKMIPCLAVPGAPLVVQAHLVGVLSWGYGCGYESDLPLVYTSMQYYQPWLLHNIPILRRVTKSEIQPIFEALRAHKLSDWIYKTRLIPPSQPQIGDKIIEPLTVDRELAMLRGKVFDIRDFIFNGTQHKHKKRLYEALKKKIEEKEWYKKNTVTHPDGVPFLDPDITKRPYKLNEADEMHLIEELDRQDSDNDRMDAE